MFNELEGVERAMASLLKERTVAHEKSGATKYFNSELQL